MSRHLVFFYFLSTLFICTLNAQTLESTRVIFHKLVQGEGDKTEILEELVSTGDPLVVQLTESWKVGEILETPSGTIIYNKNNRPEELLTAKPYSGDITKLKKNRASRSLRKLLRRVVSLVDLASPDYNRRRDAVLRLGASQNPDYIEDLKKRVDQQPNESLENSFQEAVYISLLKNGTPEEQLEAAKQLGELNSIVARDFLQQIAGEAKDPDPHKQQMSKLAVVSLEQIKAYEDRLEFIGSLFRGLSLGSVLLIVSYGLAITFGLMGVINMAHGEFIAIGAYTVYLVQNVFLDIFEAGSQMHEYYFIVAIPIAFLITAIFGALLERGVIKHLYKRPLESLLATWGISMLLQQALRQIFGAANVQVSSPQWISGGSEFWGVSLTHNRMAVILFAGVVICATWVLLNRTRIGLHIRATMQNRSMAAGLGIPSTKVNMMTFAFGSGLAGLAGAFLSQIGNVGPSMGQAYIVDSFMVVVVGGVGNLLGTVFSSLGIGMVDQILQPYIGPVMGKIFVLFAIILFLQWRPGGLFPSRSRSLDD